MNRMRTKGILLGILAMGASFFLSGEPLAPEKIKVTVDRTLPSLVKVVAENGKRYAVTGIALEPDVVVTSGMVTRFDNNKLYVIVEDRRERTSKTKEGKTFLSVEVKSSRYSASLWGRDQESGLAFLKVEKRVLKPLKAFAKASGGENVVLLGYSAGDERWIYEGVVSSLKGYRMILNAPAVPGSSGGAVLNERGELVGIIRGRFGFAPGGDFILRESGREYTVKAPREGSGRSFTYAVPSSMVIFLQGQLKKYGTLKKGWLGVTFQAYDGKVVVEKVVKGSPAEKGGIRVGDRLLEMDGIQISSAEDLGAAIRRSHPKATLKIRVNRQGSVKNLTAVLGERSQENVGDWFWNEGTGWEFSMPLTERVEIPPVPDIPDVFVRFTGPRVLGIDALELTPELAKNMKIQDGYGLLISTVFSGSAAAKAGLLVGDVLLKADGVPLKGIDDLRGVLSRKEKGKVVLDLYRNGALKRLDAYPEKNKEYEAEIAPLKNKLRELSIRLKGDKALNRRIQELQREMGRLVREISQELRREITSEKVKKNVEARVDSLKRELDKIEKSFNETLDQLNEEEEEAEKD